MTESELVMRNGVEWLAFSDGDQVVSIRRDIATPENIDFALDVLRQSVLDRGNEGVKR